jgi:hypothetical protein
MFGERFLAGSVADPVLFSRIRTFLVGSGPGRLGLDPEPGING